MIKKYYIEEEGGKEIKRKQTIHEYEDWQDLPHKEQTNLFYEASAKMLKQAKLINSMIDVLNIESKEDDLIFRDTVKNLESVVYILKGE